MPPLAIDSLGLAFAGYILVAIVLAVGFGRALGLNDQLAREQHAERREVDGPMATIADFAEERAARDARARFRHTTRFNEKSGPRRANDRTA